MSLIGEMPQTPSHDEVYAPLQALAMCRMLSVLDRVGTEPVPHIGVAVISRDDIELVAQDPDMAPGYVAAHATAMQRLCSLSA